MKGTTTGSRHPGGPVVSSTDYCSTPNEGAFSNFCAKNEKKAQLQEFYCKNNLVKEKTVDCGKNEICKNGACVPKPTPTPKPTQAPTPTPVRCADSDGGMAPRIKGTATGMDAQGNLVSKTDYCSLGVTCGAFASCVHSSTLHEYYCSNNVVREATIACGFGTACNDGRCVTSGHK